MSLGLTFRGNSRGLDLEALERAAGDAGAVLGHAGEDYQVVFCPRGVVDVRLTPGGFFRAAGVEGAVRSAAAGPGFHAAVVDFLDRLQEHAGVTLEVQDGTGYWAHRNFPMLQAHHVSWLQGVLGTVAATEAGQLLICWPLDGWVPVGVPGAVTPMGPLLPAEAQAEGLTAYADRFFLWNRRERGAQHLRGLALHAIWNQVRWVAPRSQAERELALQVLADLRRARELDPELPLPLEAFRELAALAGVEEPDPGGPELDLPEGYGYLRREIRIPHPGGWVVTLPGSLAVEQEQDGVVYWDEDRNFRLVPFQLAPGAEPPPLPPRLQDATPVERQAEPVSYHGGLLWDEHDERWFLGGRVVADSRVALVSLTFRQPHWEEWARETFLSIRSAGSEATLPQA